MSNLMKLEEKITSGITDGGIRIGGGGGGEGLRDKNWWGAWGTRRSPKYGGGAISRMVQAQNGSKSRSPSNGAPVDTIYGTHFGHSTEI